MSRIYDSESDAKNRFPGMDIEQCECCGCFTASRADHEEGGIVGPCCDDDGTAVFDRICSECDELPIKKLKELSEST